MTEKERTETPKTTSLVQWWTQEKGKLTQAEVLRLLQENKGRIEKSLASIHERNLFYRATNRLFAFFAILGGFVDKVKDTLFTLLMKIPAPSSLKKSLQAVADEFSVKGVVDFLQVKMYSLKKAPHNERAVQLMDEVIAYASTHGLDFKKHFPEIGDKFLARRDQLMQHSFFKEFSKSGLERFLATPFSFNRSISPVLEDSAMWHKIFVFLEKKNIADIVLVGDDDRRVSLNEDNKAAVGSSQVVRTLYEASVLKAAGNRVFIIGHHDGYLGPYFVRSVLRRLGFDNLAASCNTVVGPRMFSNIVLKSGASNVGNLFLTLPSQKTTEVKANGLAEELQKTARRTQFLIKMPNAGLKMIEKMSYSEFMGNILNANNPQFDVATEGLDSVEKAALQEYLSLSRESSGVMDLDRADYYLFKSIMYEPFLIFPEGSRSYKEENGDITMKYVNPRYMQAYLRPGDVILPVNLVGGSDITNGWRLSPAVLGLSVGKPYQVSSEMIENYETEGLEVMKTIAALPNIKNVYFSSDVQAGSRR